MTAYSWLLVPLKERLGELINKCETLSDKKINEPLFDTQLFKPCHPEQLQSSVFIYYLNEIELNIQYLKQKILSNQQEQIIYLADKITNQLIAMKKEIAAYQLRTINTSENNEETLYEIHCRHINYNRRLIAMKHQIMDELKNTIDSRKKTALTQQIDALNHRIYRCQQALKKIEKQLEKYTSL